MLIELNKLKTIALKMAEKQNVPSPILVYGAPGTGKTFTGNELATKMNANTHLIQCSRLTEEMLTALETFCAAAKNKNTNAVLELMGEQPRMPMVFLDEIEQLGGTVSIDKLRPIIDNYSKHVFFYATTNYIDRIPVGVKDRFITSEAKGEQVSLRQQSLLENMGIWEA